MATTTTYVIAGGTGGSGDREDILDLVINISPTDTPMFSSIRKGKANATKHEWIQDTLRAAAANAAIEGADASFSAASARTRDYNYTQIFTGTVTVSETQRAVTVVGIADEFAYQLQKELKAHVFDIENQIMTSATRTAGNDSTARVMAGVPQFVDGYSGGTGNTTDLSTAGFSEDQFNACFQAAWLTGGHPDTVFACARHKRRISKFVGNSTKYQDGTAQKIVNSIDVYESDFGTARIVPSRFITYSTNAPVWFLEMARWRLALLRPTKEVPIAKTGDAEKSLIVTELTVEGLAPKANAALKNATDAVV